MRCTPFAKTLCVTVATALALESAAIAAPPPSSPAGDPAAMTPEQKLERAKQLFGEGNAALAAGDAATALQRFEDAYYNYTPDRHKFNFNIAQAAYDTGDCVKARAAYQRFLDLVTDDPNRGDAQVKIMEIDRSGCANAQPAVTEPDPNAGTIANSLPTAEDNEDAPVLTGRKQEREDTIERERDEADAKKTPTLVIAGSVLTVVGAGVLVGGIASLAIANRRATELADLASPGPTGFPSGNYADDEVFDTDRNRLPRLNTAAVIMLIAGPALLAGGIAMLAVGVSKKKKGQKKKKKDDDVARGRHRPELVGVGPSAFPRGGGASAIVRF